MFRFYTGICRREGDLKILGRHCTVARLKEINTLVTQGVIDDDIFFSSLATVFKDDQAGSELLGGAGIVETDIITCFIGYAVFAIAFGLGLMYLVKRGDGDREGLFSSRIPQRRILDALNHQMVLFGFLFLSAGIISGAVWANSAWGRYWGWEPKETWSLITWFVYATLLHARFMRGWRGKRIAVFSMIGFVSVLITYFGVNYLPGLHSYGSG